MEGTLGRERLIDNLIDIVFRQGERISRLEETTVTADAGGAARVSGVLIQARDDVPSAPGAGQWCKRGGVGVRGGVGGAWWPLPAPGEPEDRCAGPPDSTRVAFPARDPVPADEKAAVDRRDDERQYERPARPVHLWVVDVAPNCLLYPSPSPRDRTRSRMPSSA